MSNEFVVMCCIPTCKKVREGDDWRPATEEELSSSNISHGYCPPCAEEAIKQFAEEK